MISKSTLISGIASAAFGQMRTCIYDYGLALPRKDADRVVSGMLSIEPRKNAPCIPSTARLVAIPKPLAPTVFEFNSVTHLIRLRIRRTDTNESTIQTRHCS